MSKIVQSRARSRRATITIALLIVLVLLQLVIVGVVNGGARDHELTTRRAETMRTLYAAEAGVNMGVREMMNSSDEDGDGAIGSVSADGNNSNDPTIGGAKFHVSKSVSGTDTTLTSLARFGESLRSAQAILR